MKLDTHPAANIFPMLSAEQLQEMADDIAQHGLCEPIELLGGKIIDGRNRAAACKLAGVKPGTVEVEVDDPLSYVLSRNLFRRHLTDSQRAMIAARAFDLFEEQANGRRTEKLKKGNKNPEVENLPPRETGKARDKAGEVVGVSGKSVDYGRKVVEQGAKVLQDAVDAGEIPVSTAAKLADQPKATQTAVITRGRKEGNVKAAVAEALNPKLQPGPGRKSKAEQAVENASVGKAIINSINEALRLIKGVDEIPGTELLVVRAQSIRRDLDSAKGGVQVTIPAAVCPRCKGRGCAQCGNHGWVNSQLLKELS